MSAYGRTYRLYTNTAVGSDTQAPPYDTAIPRPSNDNLDSLAHITCPPGGTYNLIIQGRLIDGSNWGDLVAVDTSTDTISSEGGFITSLRSCPQMRVKVGSGSTVAIGALHVDIIS